ncbi:MAG: RraA family protein [bacterium]
MEHGDWRGEAVPGREGLSSQTGRDKAMPLTDAELLQLKRWNTPTIYNGWEQITRHDAASEGFNFEECKDFMPQMGPMVGYAVTVQFEPSSPQHPKRNPTAWSEYREYIASVPGPKIVVVQDLDKPRVIGAFWGEVNSGIHRALGCVGTITDGAIRDLDEMTSVGFKAIARRFCVGHAHSCPVSWNCEVEVFGRKVQPGRLIHADKHGFLVIPPEDEAGLLEASRFMDSNECNTLIPAARGDAGRSISQTLSGINAAGEAFGRAARGKFGKKGEW